MSFLLCNRWGVDPPTERETSPGRWEKFLAACYWFNSFKLSKQVRFLATVMPMQQLIAKLLYCELERWSACLWLERSSNEKHWPETTPVGRHEAELVARSRWSQTDQSDHSSLPASRRWMLLVHLSRLSLDCSAARTDARPTAHRHRTTTSTHEMEKKQYEINTNTKTKTRRSRHWLLTTK